jgi:hypothetical protein
MSPKQSHRPNAGSRVNPIVGRNVLSARSRCDRAEHNVRAADEKQVPAPAIEIVESGVGVLESLGGEDQQMAPHYPS